MANNCKIFTPDSYVTELLDIAGYNRDLMGRSVLENSCGDGNILKEVVRRYITDSLVRGYTLESIRAGLEADIWGVELEQELPQDFLRCHRSYIVNMNYIANMTTGDFILQNGCHVPISATMRAKAKQSFCDWMFQKVREGI